MIVVLARHGDVRDPAAFGTPLTALGIEQAERLAQQVRQVRGFMYVSPYARCTQTAQIIFGQTGLKWFACPGLSEVGYVVGEDLPQAQARGLKEFQRLAERGDDMVIVSHGAIIQVIARALGHPDGVCERGERLVLEL